jgi:cell division protein FtsW
MLAYLIDKNPDLLSRWQSFILCVLIIVAMAAFSYRGSLSSAIILVLIGAAILFIASRHIMRFIITGTIGVGALVIYLYQMSLSGNWRGARFKVWLDPWIDELDKGFQPIQSLYAIASGGFLGLGIGQSRQKSILPEQYNDYIFSIICEELGIFGAGVILIFFVVFIWRGIRIAKNAGDTYGSVAAAGIVFIFACQVIINVAVVTNSIPSTGITLPFISYGGTSLLVSMAMVGVLLNISKNSAVLDKPPEDLVYNIREPDDGRSYETNSGGRRVNDRRSDRRGADNRPKRNYTEERARDRPGGRRG